VSSNSSKVTHLFLNKLGFYERASRLSCFFKGEGGSEQRLPPKTEFRLTLSIILSGGLTVGKPVVEGWQGGRSGMGARPVVVFEPGGSAGFNQFSKNIPLYHLETFDKQGFYEGASLLSCIFA
jgi:hypothetical protein